MSWILPSSFESFEDQFMARLYFRCGQKAEKEGSYAIAQRLYRLFLDGYADHELAKKASKAYVRVSIEHAESLKSDQLKKPEQMENISGKRAAVVVYNGSPVKLRIVFSGPEVGVQELKPCKSCQVYKSNRTDDPCPEAATMKTLRLNPGNYDLVIDSRVDPGVNPIVGAWELIKGGEYWQCIVLFDKDAP
jgi:hypothetical protein